MPRKRQAKAQSVGRTSEAIAEERIAAWRRDQKERSFPLSLNNLGLRKVPETLREVRDVRILFLHKNEIQELPPWIGELSALLGIWLDENHLRTLPPSA